MSEEQEETQDAYRDEEGWYVLDDDGLPDYVDDDQVVFEGDPEQEQLAEYGQNTLAYLQQHQAEEQQTEGLIDEISDAIDILEEQEGRTLSDAEIANVTQAFQGDAEEIELNNMSDPQQRREYLAQRYTETPDTESEE